MMNLIASVFGAEAQANTISPQSRPSQLRWSYSATLGIAYLALFHFWLLADPFRVAISTVLVASVLIWGLSVMLQRHYFVNLLDALIHAVIILDLVLEGLVVRLHEGYSFYGCAAAFAAVLISYRLWRSRALC